MIKLNLLEFVICQQNTIGNHIFHSIKHIKYSAEYNII